MQSLWRNILTLRTEKIKGNLVEINTKEENDLIQKKLEKELLPGGVANARDSIWLGITRGDGNTWNYISGKQANFIDLPWNTGEPNNSGGSEDCVSMFVGVGTKSDTSGGWNDESCGTFVADAQIRLKGHHAIQSEE